MCCHNLVPSGKLRSQLNTFDYNPFGKQEPSLFLRYPGEQIYIFATDMWPGAIHVSLRQYIKLQVKIPVNTDKKDILSFVFDELRGGFFFLCLDTGVLKL